MGQRLLAVVVVIASACTALQLSSSEHESLYIQNNPYNFPGPGSATFRIDPRFGTDHDVLQSITWTCSSQWMVNTSIDPQQPIMGAHICGSGTGSGSATFPTATGDLADANVTCPKSYQFSVYYAGTLAGTDTCNVAISSMPYFGGSASEIYTLTLTGSGSAAQGIDTDLKDMMDFGKVPTTQTASLPVTVTNIGTTAVSVTGSLVADAPFAVTGNYTSFGLGAGSSQTFNVTCTPIATTQYAGTLTFSAGSVGSSRTLQLSCEGILSTINFNPQPVVFANTLVGRAPPNQTVTITGTVGSASLESITLDSDAQNAGVTIVTNPQGMQIGSGKNVVLAYSAATAHPSGPLGALLVKASSDTAARPLAIRGEALLGGVGTNPASVEFGAVCVGSKVMKDVEVYANEAGNVQLQQLTKPAAPFDAMLMESLPKILGGNHSGVSATARVTFDPTEPGDFKDALALKSNVPNTDTTEVQLHGIGLAEGIAATPNSVHFGLSAVKMTTSIKEVQFSNCGTTDLMFNRAYISGVDALEFTLIGAYPGQVLKPTESITFMVVMQPTTNGLKAAKLMIEHAEGVTPVDLDGMAEGGSDKDRETYYACSTGRSGSLWPIVLALALVALRRRRGR